MSSTIFSSPGSIFIIIALNSYQLDWLTLFHFFWGFFLGLSFGAYSYVSLFCMTLCTWFFELVEKAHLLNLEGLALSKRIPFVYWVCLVAWASQRSTKCKMGFFWCWGFAGHGSRGMALGPIGEDPGWTPVGYVLVGGRWWSSRGSRVCSR